MKTEKHFVRVASWLLIFTLLSVALAFGITAADYSDFLYSLLGEQKKSELLKFLGLSMGGILLALQALASHKRARAMEDAAKAQAVATEQQAIANRYVERGQRQERLRTAIEHLGSQDATIRIGARYELFGLAEDTKELRNVVFDILCAYIRETTSKPDYRETHQQRPSREIQELLNLLFVQRHDMFAGMRINLEESWLIGANLHGARLTKASLENTVLRRALLAGAQMQGAVLLGAHMEGAIAESIKLHGSLLIGTKLTDANLINAEMQGSLLLSTDLQSALMSGTNLMGISSPTDDQAGRRMPLDFAKRIENSVGRQSDLSGIVLDNVTDLQTIQEFVRNRGAIIGAFSEAEACEWISEYRRIVSG